MDFTLEAVVKKTGKALHQADAEVDETSFGSGNLVAGVYENAAVLATSGATTKEGGSIGNSCLYVDLAASFIVQWDDDALMRRDKAPERRTHHTAAAATTAWDLSSPSSTFLEQDTVDGGEWETALGTYEEPWEEEPEGAEVLDDDWTDELPPKDPELEDQIWLPGSSGGLCSDGVPECFVGHEKRHTNILGGQGSGFSSKARKRLLPCGRCRCFRWFSDDNAERITTDWRWERCEHWHEQPGR